MVLQVRVVGQGLAGLHPHVHVGKTSRGIALVPQLILCFQQNLVHSGTFASSAKCLIQRPPWALGVLDLVTGTQLKHNKCPRLPSCFHANQKEDKVIACSGKLV